MRAFFLFFPIFILALLFSFCGGPLFVADLLTPRFGAAGFLAAIAPLMIALVGASSFMKLDPIGTGRHLRFGGRAVVVGLIGVIITGLMNAFALWRLAMGEDRLNRSLIMTGIIVGTVLSIGYAYLTWRYLGRPRGPKVRRCKRGTLPLLALRPATEHATFTFPGQDSLSQFMMWLGPILGGGCLPPPFIVWYAGGMTAAALYTLAALAGVGGLRDSIVVTASLV